MAPSGEDWIYELHWGGERVRAMKLNGGVWLMNREGRNLTNRFPRVAAAVAALRVPAAVLDGEILVLDNFPRSAVRLLAGGCDEIDRAQVALLAYDLLHRGEDDMRRMPLLGRRVVLASLIQGTPIILSPLCHGTAGAALQQAASIGLGGIVAKRAGSSYQPSTLLHTWVKVSLPRRPDGEGSDAGVRAQIDAGVAALRD